MAQLCAPRDLAVVHFREEYWLGPMLAFVDVDAENRRSVLMHTDWRPSFHDNRPEVPDGNTLAQVFRAVTLEP